MSKIKKAIAWIKDNAKIIGLASLAGLLCCVNIILFGWLGYVLDVTYNSNGITTGVLVGVLMVVLMLTLPKLKD